MAACYDGLGRRGQIGRLRRLGQSALAAYGLEHARLTSLRHEHNTTFRVDGAYVLRINRPGSHSAETIGSEMAWLRALRADTALGVPEPVAARDGSLVVVASHPGVPEPRACVLLRRLEGRFVDARLAPRHMRLVARLAAALHEHAGSWTPPDGFTRPRVDLLTSEAKAGLIAPGDDAGAALELVAGLMPGEDAQDFAAALEAVRDTARVLDAQPGSAGLIHADLHQENYLFGDGVAKAIDFDDCGRGHFLYDLAVTLSELDDRPRYDELRAALLGEYATLRPLPERHEAHLAGLMLLRRMQLLLWGLESRRHPAFRDTWRKWAREDMRVIRAAIRRA